MKEQIQIKHSKKKVVVSKDWERKAGIFESEEYETYQRIRQQLPDYKIIVKRKENKQTHKGLNFDRIEKLIYLLDVDKLDTYEKIKEHYSNKKEKYVKVKKWFLDTFPDYIEQEKEQEEKALKLLVE